MDLETKHRQEVAEKTEECGQAAYNWGEGRVQHQSMQGLNDGAEADVQPLKVNAMTKIRTAKLEAACQQICRQPSTHPTATLLGAVNSWR